MRPVFERIEQMVEESGTMKGVFPATEIYNEKWMLRIILDWFSHQPPGQHPFSFGSARRWFSEASLPSQFLAKYQGDPLSETWTPADGVIGDFEIGRVGRGDLSINTHAKHFVAIEAKMFSKLAPGTKNAKNFDQAARYVACIAEALKRSNVKPDSFLQLGFYVVAPSAEIKTRPTFMNYTSKQSIRQKVLNRVKGYSGRQDEKEKSHWFSEWFLPTVERITISCLSWEEIVDHIQDRDSGSCEEIAAFYEKCLDFNRPTVKKLQLTSITPGQGDLFVTGRKIVEYDRKR